MGILNVTPDSFADGGHYPDTSSAVEAACRLEAAGADIIDIGGESTRPGAAPVSVDDERQRVLPAVEQVVANVTVPVSVDTYKSEVAQEALERGASMINDISACSYDPRLAEVVARGKAPIVLMHNRGRSRQMYRDARYDRLSDEVVVELRTAVERVGRAGVSLSQIVVDPGLGFAKRAEQTLEMLASLEALHPLDRPVLVGPSRKSFLTLALGERAPTARDWGTAAAVATAVLHGAHIVRVHAVKEMVDVVRVVDSIVARSAASASCGAEA